MSDPSNYNLGETEQKDAHDGALGSTSYQKGAGQTDN
jgi:hypothetical protein